jgi:hypothetical protein
LTALLLAAAVRADDGFVSGVSGTPKLMKSHRSIRMVAEWVHITVPEGRVHAVFLFRNDGPATTVAMGFPEEGGGDGHFSDWTYLDGFRRSVGGRRLRVRRLVDATGRDYSYWWVSKVHFAAHQTRRVTVDYTGGVGGMSTGDGFLQYVLRTGSSWHGRIGHVRVVATCTDGAGWTFSGRPDGYRRFGRALVWDMHNVKPQDDVYIDWKPAEHSVYVSGQRVERFTSGNSYFFPERHGRDVLVGLVEAAHWLGASVEMLTDSQPFRVRLSRDGHSVEVREGSAVLSGGDRQWTMPQRAMVRGDRLVVRLGPLVEALGGTMAYRAGRDILAIDFPPRQPPVLR